MNVGAAFSEIKKKIILDFCDSLENRLIGLYNEFQIRNLFRENDVLAKWPRFHVSKKAWENKYAIAIVADKSGPRDFHIGLWRDEKNTSNPIDEGRLKELLNRYRAGGSGGSWIWWFWVDDDYRHWDEERVLIRLYKKDEALSYFVDRVLKIKDIVFPIIDEAIKTN